MHHHSLEFLASIPAAAIRVMQRVGWAELSDTHQYRGGDGFREGLNPSYGLATAVGLIRFSAFHYMKFDPGTYRMRR
jgi:hypothetical protein